MVARLRFFQWTFYPWTINERAFSKATGKSQTKIKTVKSIALTGPSAYFVLHTLGNCLILKLFVRIWM